MGENGQNVRTFRFGEYELFPEERLLERSGERVKLTPRVLDALVLLVAEHGHIVAKETLLQKLWPNSFVEENNISQAISSLRKSLGHQPNGSDFIETVPKVGYRFVAPVIETESSNGQFLNLPNNVTQPTVSRRSVWPSIVLVLLVLTVLGLIGWRHMRSEIVAPPRPMTESVPRRLTSTAENEQVAGWTTDGRIIVTRWANATTPETFAMGADGSGFAKMTAPADVRQFVASPDGSRMICWKYGDSSAFIAAADGGGMIKLPFAVENAAWSPDGSRFAFQANATGDKKLASTELLVYSVKDAKLTELTSNTSFDGDPGWSPDGKTLVFSSDREGNYEIYWMKADGSDVRRLTNNAGHDSFPKFSPDGTQIAFNSNIERETTDVYVMNSDGANPVRMTTSKGNDLSRNGWSPDGTKFAYNSDIDGNDEIYLIDIEPFKPELLIEDKEAELQTPSYSPDGKRVVYTAEFADKHSELRVYDRETKRSTLILTTSSPQNYPRWSPDGQWIAFHQEVSGKWDVFKVRPDGSEISNLTSDPSSDSIPTWSADSATIYFRSNRNGDTENSELFKMNADGSGQTLLPIKKGKLGWGSVSPNGTEIAFASDRGGDLEKLFDIFIGDLGSGTERLIASRPKNDIQPTFSISGSQMAFVAASDGNQEIYVVKSDGSGILRLTRNSSNDLNPSFSFDGKSILFASSRNGKAAIFLLQL